MTTAHLGRIGVAPGWRCLELGAGGGSIAAWLATQVGSAGRVVATDFDVSRIRTHSLNQLEVHRLDLVTDALPLGPWDLIHERLVLQHVPARLEVLDRMLTALAPGGWVVLEDFDTAEVADPSATLMPRRRTSMITSARGDAGPWRTLLEPSG